MKQTIRLCAMVLTFALGASQCAIAQPQKKATPMIIDKLSATKHWDHQTLLSAHQHQAYQQTMLSGVEKLLQGKYRITAQRIYLLPPDHRIVPNPLRFKIGFKDGMVGIDPHAELLFANETIDWPYLNIWKTSGPHPEYVAISLYSTNPHDYRSPKPNTLLGFFELEPVK